MNKKLSALVLTLGVLGSSGCAPLILGGAMMGGAMVATDRRSVGIQMEDEAIERRIDRAISERFKPGTINVNVTSYNRKVLLTGQVPSGDTDIAQIGDIAQRAENVRAVVNELRPIEISTVGIRSNDTGITGLVRTALLNEHDVPSGAIKATTERNTVYLLGRVSEAEGEAAARVVSRVQKVQRVVKLFDYISEAEAAEFRRNVPSAPAPTSEGSRRPSS